MTASTTRGSQSHPEGSSPALENSFIAYAVDAGGALQRLPRLAKLDERLRNKIGKGLVLYRNPACLLGPVFEARKSHIERLSSWTEEARAALVLIQGRQEALTVIERSPVIDEASRSVFQDEFPNQPEPVELFDLAASRSAVIGIVAAFAVYRDAAATSCLAELQAASAIKPRTLVPAPDFQELADELESQTLSAAELARAISENAALKTSREEAESMRRYLLTQLDELEEAFERLEQDKARAVTAAADLRRDIAILKAESNAKAEAMQSQIEAIYASTSWRISAPVRAIRRLLAH